MGNGHPIAGMVARPEVLKEFGEAMRYFNTFGGNPVSAAVGMAVLDVIEREGLVANAARIGAYLADGIEGLANISPIIGDIRAAGLFIGVELVRDRGTREPAAEEAARVVNGLRARNVLISAAGHVRECPQDPAAAGVLERERRSLSHNARRRSCRNQRRMN